MKKVLAISLALIIGLSLSAQIQNNLLGFTLGVSTKYEVYNKYKDEVKFTVDEIGTISVGDIVFAGYKWDYTSFSFYDNKLESIHFFNTEPFTPEQIMQLMWERLRTSLLNKYSDYLQTDSTADFTYFLDGKIDLVLSYSGLSSNEKSISLNYYDHSLRLIRMQAEEDEL